MIYKTSTGLREKTRAGVCGYNTRSIFVLAMKNTETRRQIKMLSSKL